MIHDTEKHEKHTFINKPRITSIHNKLRKETQEQKSINKITITWIHFIHNQIHAQTNKSIQLFLDVYSVLFFSCSTVCVCVCHSFHGLLWECLRARHFRAFLLLHLHPAVIGALAVWIQNPPKKKWQLGPLWGKSTILVQRIALWWISKPDFKNQSRIPLGILQGVGILIFANTDDVTIIPSTPVRESSLSY